MVWKLARNILLDGWPAAGFVCEQNSPPDTLQIVMQVCWSETPGICYTQDPLNLLVWCWVTENVFITLAPKNTNPTNGCVHSLSTFQTSTDRPAVPIAGPFPDF